MFANDVTSTLVVWIVLSLLAVLAIVGIIQAARKCDSTRKYLHDTSQRLEQALHDHSISDETYKRLKHQLEK